MNLKNKLVKQKIYEAWSPRIKRHLESKGVKNISESKLRQLCEAAQVRKMYESATTSNTPGRGTFSLGNNPAAAGDNTRGSGEHFDALFGVFIDTYANTVGMDMVPTVQMGKSNLLVNIVEPVYADGRLEGESQEDLPSLVQVELVSNGTGVNLVVGTEYDVLDAFGGTELIKLTYVGAERVKGAALFRVGAKTSADALDSIFDSPVSGAGVYDTAANNIQFRPNTLGYVNAYTNHVSGFSGAGLNDNENWSVGRTQGTEISSGMSRQVGESQKYRTMGLTKFSQNYSAETTQVKIAYTIEMLQDLAVEDGIDAQELAYNTISNELSQAINDEILDKHHGLGWGHHADLFALSGLNLNLHISDNQQAAATSFFDQNSVSRSIAAANGALISTTNGDNLPSMQRRIVSRLTFASAAIGQRSRKGKGNVACTNARLSSALQDVRGFTAAPFENNLAENDNLYQVGNLRKVSLFEDSMADLGDNRITLSRKGGDNDSGLKLLSYILAERVDTIAEGTMSNVSVLKSRYTVQAVGDNPQLNNITFTVTEGSGQSII